MLRTLKREYPRGRNGGRRSTVTVISQYMSQPGRFVFSRKCIDDGMVIPGEKTAIIIENDKSKKYVIFRPAIGNEASWKFGPNKAVSLVCKELADLLGVGQWTLQKVKVGRGAKAVEYTGFYY